MPLDERLADRIRTLLDREEDRTGERRMFGGIAFLVDGQMAVAASGAGGLMVRVAPEDEDALLSEPGVTPMVMRERPVTGWLRVAAEAVEADDALAAWVARGLARARSLPRPGG